MKYDFLIVGSGLAGSVLAERIATQLDKHVLMIDKRPHIAGNCYDYKNEHGIHVHQYGPHIFHTSNKKVHDYVLRFTRLLDYRHRVFMCGERQNRTGAIQPDFNRKILSAQSCKPFH